MIATAERPLGAETPVSSSVRTVVVVFGGGSWGFTTTCVDGEGWGDCVVTVVVDGGGGGGGLAGCCCVVTVVVCAIAGRARPASPSVGILAMVGVPDRVARERLPRVFKPT